MDDQEGNRGAICMSHYGFEAATRRRLEANEDDDGGMTSARQGLSDLNGPERTPYIGLDKMLHQALRLDGSESDAGGDGASMESSSPVPPASVPIPTRPGLTRVQSSFTSYSSRSPASRTTSVTSLYDSLGSSAPRTNSAESVPRQSTLKTQMLPPGRPTTTATAQPEDRPRPYPSRSTSSSSDAHYLPYPPSYPVPEPVHHLGPSGAPYHPQRPHPHLYAAPVHSGYLAAPNTPAYVPTPGATPQHLYHPRPYGAGQPYYPLHPGQPVGAGQPYIFGQPVYGGQPAGLVATADGQYMQLVASQPYGPTSGPTHATVYAQPAYVPPMSAYERTLAERSSFGPPRPQRQPSGYAGSEASSPSSYQPGYHLPNLSPHLLDHHFVTYSPPSTETSPGTGPVSPFDASATNVPYPISASRSSSSEQIIEQQRRRLSGAHRDDGQTLSPVGREPGPEDPAFAQRNFARPSASVRPLEGDPRSRSDVEGGPDAMERRYATRVGYPAPALPPPVVAGGAHGPGTSTSGRGGQQGPASAAGRPGWSGSRAGGGGRARKDLPRPPTHSLHALWVGNVPSDASHAELWQFFQTRPTPKECGMVATPGDETADLDSNGVESIHLITRSNCAFVNYATNLHLHHSIAVTNGVPLRPEDPRSKPLVCRVRKAEDDSKSGVGAQRMGGMHMAFVRAQQVKMQQEQRALREKSPTSISEQGLSPPQGMSDKRRKSTVSVNSAGTSIGSTSTTSSFLAKHFERRYFILKSHDMADLQKSVETGMWATQPHNEPVLQQAFRTARSVYLLFGANGAGSWFGYARMAGPISNSGGGSSSHSTRSHGSSAGARSATSADQRFTYPGGETIVEESEAGASSSEVEPPAPHLFSPSENRWLDVSPLGITPTTTASPASTLGEHTGGSAPATLAAVPAEARRAMSLEQERMALETAERLHLPPDVTQDARKTVSYDPRPREPSPPASPQGELRIKTEDTDEGLLASGEQTPEEDAFVSAVEARNAHLDKIESARSRANTATADKRSPPKAVKTEGASTPFAIEWIVIRTLPFSRTRHVRNSFNGNREVKISRDGTEIEPTAGELVLNEFWRRDPSSRTEVPMRPSSPQPLWHGSGHSGARTPSRNAAGVEDDEDKTPPGRPSSTGAPARASEPPPKSPAVVSPYEGRSETV